LLVCEKGKKLQKGEKFSFSIKIKNFTQKLRMTEIFGQKTQLNSVFAWKLNKNKTFCTKNRTLTKITSAISRLKEKNEN
jgi:hypothetical protein